MLGLVESWTRGVQALRVAELQRSKRFRTFIAYMNVLGRHIMDTALTSLLSVVIQETRLRHWRPF